MEEQRAAALANILEEERVIAGLLLRIQGQLAKILAAVEAGTTSTQQGLTALNMKVNKMADVLDQIQAEETTVVADLAVLQAAVQSVISVLQGLQNGSISTSDPRFAAALASANQMDASITAMTGALNAANPPVAPAPAVKP